MCHKLDPRFFNKLSQKDPCDVCRRTLAEYDREKRVYKITALGYEYEISPETCEIRSLSDNGPAVTVEWGLTLLFYMLKAQKVPIFGKWVGEFDLKGGSTFFRGPHAFPVKLIAESFARDPDGFKNAGARLNGTAENMGDASFNLLILPRIPVMVILWLADDEFPAQAKIVMDATIEKHLPLDVIFGMAVTLCALISGTPAE